MSFLSWPYWPVGRSGLPLHAACLAKALRQPDRFGRAMLEPLAFVAICTSMFVMFAAAG